MLKKWRGFIHEKRQMNWDFFQKKSQSRWFPLKVIGVLLLLYVGVVAWTLRDFIGTGFLAGRTLVLFTNEAEARPCGGFVSAYGTVRVFPPSIDFHNSYDLGGQNFGLATPPLDKVSATKNFWDLGTSPDLSLCAEEFRTAFEKTTTTPISHVLLFDTKTAEQIFALFGTVKFGDQILNGQNFFAEMSRLVADVDRHSESALSERKLPLSHLAKKMIVRSIFNPSLLPRAAAIVAKNANEGLLFSPEVSPYIAPEDGDFSLIEWNLGGAKSSRFLKKTIRITARETYPNKWGFFVEVLAQHLGGMDEPLSQAWKGVFEVRMPKFLNADPIFIEAELDPGRAFYKAFPFEYEGDLKEFSIFRPRGMPLFGDVSVSLFPQKTFLKSSFPTHENVGTFFGEIKSFRQTFGWEEAPDTSAPFVTLHEIISPATLSASPEGKEVAKKITLEKIIAEIHFNEPVILEHDFKVSLKDLNIENKALSEDPGLSMAKLFQDRKTLILTFFEIESQPNERYSLEISGVKDWYGNLIKVAPRTLIDRQSGEGKEEIRNKK